MLLQKNVFCTTILQEVYMKFLTKQGNCCIRSYAAFLKTIFKNQFSFKIFSVFYSSACLHHTHSLCLALYTAFLVILQSIRSFHISETCTSVSGLHSMLKPYSLKVDLQDLQQTFGNDSESQKQSQKSQLICTKEITKFQCKTFN